MNDTENDFLFHDRNDAALQLIDTIATDLFQEGEAVVIGVSEGGVYFADRVAQALHASFDILLTEAIKAPHNEEIDIAMISETKEVVIHKALVDAFDISEDFVYAEAQRKYDEEVIGYVYRYRKGKDLLELHGKPVVLVDECIETGLTMMAALKSVIAQGAKNIYIATPILDKSVWQNLSGVCDAIFCPHAIDHYVSIEHYFKSLQPLDYDQIMHIIEKHNTKSNQEESE